LDKYIFSDPEISGQSLVGREGLQQLIRLAKTSPRPFDGVIIDDTSRLGRYSPDVLKQVDILENYGVFVYFAALRLDSRDPGFRQVLTIYAMMDEQHVAQLAQKVHRGQKGRALKGYVHEYVNHTKKEYARGDVHENRAECCHLTHKSATWARILTLSSVTLPIGLQSWTHTFANEPQECPLSAQKVLE